MTSSGCAHAHAESTCFWIAQRSTMGRAREPPSDHGIDAERPGCQVLTDVAVANACPPAGYRVDTVDVVGDLQSGRQTAARIARECAQCDLFTDAVRTVERIALVLSSHADRIGQLTFVLSADGSRHVSTLRYWIVLARGRPELGFPQPRRSGTCASERARGNQEKGGGCEPHGTTDTGTVTVLSSREV